MLNILATHIKSHYGSKSGFLNTYKYQALLVLGSFSKYSAVELKHIRRLVFVCAGNICRSPLAEVAARQAGAEAASYGLHCRGGDGADSRAVSYAAKHGLDLKTHVTKNIKDYEPRRGDLLIGMEPRHVIALEELFFEDVTISLAGLWLPRKKVYLHDPFSAGEKFFTRCEEDVLLAAQLMAKAIGK